MIPSCRNLFALLVGINEYQNPDHYRPLSGAIHDVDLIEKFLLTNLSVPRHRVRTLLESDATKDNIIHEIQRLQIDPDIDYGDPILLYYAGHGARSPAPADYNTYASDGWFESLCPVDISPPNVTVPSPVTGIPDVVLDLLISELAEKKGDNITVIFDCCHSANAARGDMPDTWSNFTVRGTESAPQLSIADLSLPSPVTYSNALRNSLDCCVLLAACGRGEQAMESPKGGFFTQALLKSLSRRSWDGLTYRQLMRSLEIPESQHPLCEGTNSDRYLFKRVTQNQSYFYGKMLRGDCVLEAGSIFDIRLDEEFDIFEETDDSGKVCSLKIAHVENDHSLFAMPPYPVTIPAQFHAQRTSLPKIKFYASDPTELHEISSASDFASRVDTESDAELVISFEDGFAHFSWGSKSVISSHEPKLPIGRPVPMSDKQMIIRIVRAAAHFHRYLQVGEQNILLGLELHRLKEESKFIQNIPINTYVPSGQNLLDENHVARIVVVPRKPDGPFGVKISNFHRRDLCPHVFWFHSCSLKIESWYFNQDGTCHSLPAWTFDHGESLPGSCGIGYGENNVTPWAFRLYDNRDVDVDFCKVIATTAPVNLGPLAQVSPFDGIPRDGGTWQGTGFKWFTRTATVVVKKRT